MKWKWDYVSKHDKINRVQHVMVCMLIFYPTFKAQYKK